MRKKLIFAVALAALTSLNVGCAYAGNGMAEGAPAGGASETPHLVKYSKKIAKYCGNVTVLYCKDGLRGTKVPVVMENYVERSDGQVEKSVTYLNGPCKYKRLEKHVIPNDQLFFVNDGNLMVKDIEEAMPNDVLYNYDIRGEGKRLVKLDYLNIIRMYAENKDGLTVWVGTKYSDHLNNVDVFKPIKCPRYPDKKNGIVAIDVTPLFKCMKPRTEVLSVNQ